MNDFMELRRILAIVLRRWWWLVLATGLAALVGNVISRQQTPVYQATTTILVGDSIKSTDVDRVDIQVSEALVQTYVEIARRQPVLQGVVTALNLDQSWQSLNNQITVTLIESTQLIEIVVEANSPEMARMIADEIVNQMILLSPANIEGANNESINNFNREQIQSLQQRILDGQNRLAEIDTALSTSISEIELADLQREKTTLQGLMVEWEKNYAQLLILTEPKRNPTQITVIESAHSDNRQIRPRTQLNTVVAGLVGLIIALGIIFLMDFLDDTYKSVSDFSQSEEVNILGSIRKIKGRKLADKIVAHLHPYSPITESYRIIRSRIRFKPDDKPTRSIMVTSSMPAEGKSVTVANLAVVFAQANHRTLIVDADLRHPALHDVFSVSNEVGLGDLLTLPELKVEDCIRNTSVKNLQILTSGMPLLDPSERLGSKRMEEILSELKNAAEIVIFDSPPVLVFADAIVLSRRTDGVIVVIQAGKTKRSAITQTLFDLQNANANLLGSIFNQSPQSDAFSVNKAYMQERPQLPSRSRTLERKDSTDGGRFHDLRDSATPLSGSLVVGSEEVSVDTTHAHNEAESREPEQKVEFVDLRDSATPLNESLESENEETIIDESIEENMETQFHDLAEEVESEHIVEVDDLPSSESDTTVQEFASPQTAKVNMSRKHRSRRNRKNGHTNEEVPDGQIRTSVDHENIYPKNGQVHDLTEKEADTPADQGTVAVDQTEE